MITIISPATTMNFNKNISIASSSTPVFLDKADYLINILRTLTPNEISKLMNLSDELTNLNFNRYLNFSINNNTKLQSILAFDGEVFNSMNIDSFSVNDLNFANKHLRILSGLYGILRPFDLIEPYRLEMKVKLTNNCGSNLYSFWKQNITNYLSHELENENSKILLNLASSEYIKCIDLKAIYSKSFKFVTIVFKEFNSSTNTYKTIGLYAKRARGYMINYIIKNKIDNVDELKKFNLNGYSYNGDLSDNNTITFTR